MSTLTALARAIAAERGAAQPACAVRHVHISERPFVFIPLALAGEANAPLAALVGDSPQAPRLLTVAEPRDRDQRFDFAAELAAIVLRYIGSYLGSEETAAPGSPGSATRTHPSSWSRTRPAWPSPACSAGPPASAAPRALTLSRRPCPSSAAGSRSSASEPSIPPRP